MSKGICVVLGVCWGLFTLCGSVQAQSVAAGEATGTGTTVRYQVSAEVGCFRGSENCLRPGGPYIWVSGDPAGDETTAVSNFWRKVDELKQAGKPLSNCKTKACGVRLKEGTQLVALTAGSDGRDLPINISTGRIRYRCRATVRTPGGDITAIVMGGGQTRRKAREDMERRARALAAWSDGTVVKFDSCVVIR